VARQSWLIQTTRLAATERTVDGCDNEQSNYRNRPEHQYEKELEEKSQLKSRGTAAR
jgi:hypothetical protein